MIDYNTARSIYLADLQKTYTTDQGHTRPRVRSINFWKDISPFSKTGRFVNLTEEIAHGRRVFAVSDPHFGHTNIIKFCERPFASVADMNDKLVQAINTVVTPDDIIVFGGDISFLPDKATNEILRQIVGYKILVYGNHDMTRTGQLYNLDFDERHLVLVVDVGDMSALITHYPVIDLPPGVYNIHGHMHDKPFGDVRHRCISVERINYTPILLTEIFNDFKNTHSLS